MAWASLRVGELGTVVERALFRHGLPLESASAVANVVAAAERDGCPSHGLFRVPGFLHSLRSGVFDPKVRPERMDTAPGAIVVDAHGGFAPPAFAAAEALLVHKAQEQGVACLSIRNVRHFSALWYEVEALAAQGLVSFAFVNSKAFVAHAPGGTSPVYGTNPVAFGCPRAGAELPLVFDQASAAMARGEIQLLQQAGSLLPEGVALDSSGQPTRDPAQALEGAQLPFGGHKGTSIALMVELLAGALTSSPFSIDSLDAPAPREPLPPGDSPTLQGEFILAVDPGRLGLGSTDDFSERAERLLGHIKGQTPSPGSDLRLPSERRYRNRLATQERGGVVRVPGPLLDSVLDAAAGGEDAGFHIDRHD